MVDITATQNSGFLTFQTDGNGTVYPATIDINSPYGILTVDWVSGSGFAVSDANGDTAYALDPATDYADFIDNSGFMSGDVITGLGNDSIINRGNIADDIYLGHGNDNYTAGAAGTSGDIYGGAGNDVINARGGNQSIFGEDGNDFLRGGEGNDSLHGGFGVDYLRGGAGADVLNGFAGQDWADYITSSASVTVNLLSGTGTSGEAQGDTYLFVERVYGSNHNDNITGDTGVNYLRGAGGDDMLFGGAGTDYLQGDAGADALDGGAGSDWAFYASSTSGLTIDLGTPSNSTGEAVGDTYVSIENIVGSRYDDIIYGDTANNFLRGLQGIDQLFGGNGNDFLRGDQGANVLDGGAGLDWAYYATSTAAVTVDLAAGTASGGDATGDSFISVERVFGSVFGDSITGDAGHNALRGFSGNDMLYGGDGADILQGDAGADTLDGGAGTDWAYYASATSGVTINLGNSALNTGEAKGDIYISIENMVGGRYGDAITGDSGDNYLRGFLGDDIITGGAGNDTLRGDAGADTFVFEVGTQTDKVIDYNDAEDMLDFSDFGFIDVNDALSNAVDTAGGDVVFNIGADIITIEDTTIADITDNLIV